MTGRGDRGSEGPRWVPRPFQGWGQNRVPHPSILIEGWGTEGMLNDECRMKSEAGCPRLLTDPPSGGKLITRRRVGRAVHADVRGARKRVGRASPAENKGGENVRRVRDTPGGRPPYSPRRGDGP